MADALAHINYIELPAPNMDATKAFYSQIFGWQWTDYGPGYADTATPFIVGLNATAQPCAAASDGDENVIGPFTLMQTNSLDEVLALVVAAGGRVSSGPYPYPGGRRFHFVDPSGNTIGICQSDAP
jgi:uncharacterized protein